MPKEPAETAQSQLAADSASLQGFGNSWLREATEIDDGLPHPVRLREGERIADRFLIERMAGRGGMGAVYRALDVVMGTPVALKVMTGGAQDVERFAQEVRVLAHLSHPTIVRYVAHGMTSHGAPFLAMEWLEGEDLAGRLARTGLHVAESLSVARRVAEGLATAHVRGVVHRDVKPSNVFLVGGDPGQAKLLDFGIVRLRIPHAPTARPLTGTGEILGTVGYMSPEQAIADRDLDARADVFALGCVLFECLTGRPAFSGAHVVAVLAKILREDAPRVRHLRPELSGALDDLIVRMLTKDRRGRPADGSALLRELEEIGSVAGGVPSVGAPPSLGLSGGEKRLISVMLAIIPNDSDAIAEIVRRHGGELLRLVNGALLITVSGRPSTSEQVVAAALCALDLYQACRAARIAVSVGRVQTTANGVPGAVIDQAAALLAQSTSTGIRIDDVTAGLLGERFEVHEEEGARLLVSRRSDAEPPRTLLGKPTPCVGRDKELALLRGTLRECVDESVARAVLVTGPPGQGKSRLRHEFVGATRTGGDAAIFAARADPIGAGSSFMVTRQLIRQAVGVREGDPTSEQNAKLRARVVDVCKGADSSRIADFLGELLGLPTADRPTPELRSARGDPQIMATWLGRSFGEWMAAECEARPVLVVVEDLHWGDLPSVTYLGEALRKLAEKPFMVLALARPEVEDIFPNLWPAAEKQTITLNRLSPRAAERLVRAALGDGMAPEAVARVVQRADGNAFYLEELIRRVADGGGDTLPETVLALVQSRIERLELDARKIVRAASVFGEVFWQGALAPLLGVADPGDLDGWLTVLGAREMFTARSESRFQGHREYSFRHGLLREAAYAMLTEDDRRTGHRLAAEWLERAGETDATTMADHFERGGEPRRAVPWMVRGAVSALMGGNLEATLQMGERGVAAGANDFERARMRLAQAAALSQRGDWRGALSVAGEAMGLLPPGSTRWFGAASSVLCAAVLLNDRTTTTSTLQSLLETPVRPEPTVAYATAVHVACTALGILAKFDLARAMLERADASAEAASDPDRVLSMRLQYTRAQLQLASGDLAAALHTCQRVRDLLLQAEDAVCRAGVSMLSAQAFAEVGSVDRARAAARELRLFSHMALFTTHADCAVAIALLSTGRAPEAVASLRKVITPHDQFLALSARAFLGVAFVQDGDASSAEQEASMVLDGASLFPSATKTAMRVAASVALQRNQRDEALAWVGRALDGGPPGWWSVSNESALHLARAEALHAMGRADEARGAIRGARDRILEIAATLDFDPELRASYLGNIVANARTLELARDWLGEDFDARRGPT